LAKDGGSTAETPITSNAVEMRLPCGIVTSRFGSPAVVELYGARRIRFGSLAFR
jgi:hypothetical protein